MARPKVEIPRSQRPENIAQVTDSASQSNGKFMAHQKRFSTVYDAVAGRVGTTGFLPTINTATNPTAPEDVLFRRLNAPPRYEEADPYFPPPLPDSASLPSSDMLVALHAYASDYYGSSLTNEENRADWQSMDETALLAIGILLEELAADKLGATGDLVFTEPDNFDDGQEDQKDGPSIIASIPIEHHRRRMKRRKVSSGA